jgi:hypothetical protein
MSGIGPRAQSLPGGVITGAEQVGTFSYLVAEDTWWLSPATCAMHGLPAGSRVTTEMLVAFKHPDDLIPPREVLEKVLSEGEPFCFPHRIVDTAGRSRNIVVIGITARDATETVSRVEGYAIDLTDAQGQAQKALGTGTEAVHAELENRAAIEQAKGALMLAYGMSADAAVALLGWYAQQYDIQLNLVAERLVLRLKDVTVTSSGIRRTIDRMMHDAARTEAGTRSPFEPWEFRLGAGCGEPTRMIGYSVLSTESEVGEVDGFLAFAGLQALIVDTSAWVVAQRIALPVGTVQYVDHYEHRVQLDCSLAEIKAAPPSDPCRGDRGKYLVRVADYYRSLYRDLDL